MKPPFISLRLYFTVFKKKSTLPISTGAKSARRIPASFARLGAILVLVALATSALFSSSARSSSPISSPGRAIDSAASAPLLKPTADLPALKQYFTLATMPQATPGIQTFASDCTTPKTDFKLGDTVCAQATGLVGFRFAWVDAAGFIVQRTDITSDPQTDVFTLPTDETSLIGGVFTVDNRGTWQANVITSRGSVRARSLFNVTSNNAVADLSIIKTRNGDAPVAGGPVQFSVTITNAGPNDAANVHFVDSNFTNATFNSVAQTGGPAFTCSGSGSADCTIASLPNGASATFTLNFTAGTAGGNLTNTATVSSDTTELNPGDNSSSSAPIVVASNGTPPACTVSCPNNIAVTADATFNGQNGSYVTYPDPTTSGSCGTVTTSNPSGSFFPVGDTVVTVTSGDGMCSFTVTVTAPVSISCPADKTVNAGPSCTASVDVGTPTSTGDNVTMSSSRSDGLPLSSPYSLGTTTITWTATAHSSSPPTDANVTGTATCTQNVIVSDKTPPTITAPPQTVSADASCQATIPNLFATGGATASDNCSDPTTLTVSQDVAPGTVVGLGPHTITLTATDESGNTVTQTTTFTVVDTTPPSFTFVPPSVVAYTGPGATSCDTVISNATLGTATAGDNCSAVTITRSPSGNTFPVGTTTITWIATDGAGNTATATQSVTVIDNTPPAISCPTDLIVNFDPGVNGAVVTYSAPVGTDNCAGATTTQTAGLPSGGTFPLGTTTNTYKVTDSAGNSASCSFNVTVALTSIIGLDSVSITGAGPVDSYDSNGGYPATKGSLANVVSNGTITLSGSAKVSGNVRSTRAGVAMSGASQVTGNATAGTTVSRSGSASVGGTITNNALAPTITLPAVSTCSPFSSSSGISGTYSYNASTGDLSLTGVNVATLANGTYCFHNVSVGNSAQLKVNGPVTIKLTGTLSTSGAASINNTTVIPSNLRILSSYSGSNGVTFGNSASAYLLVYAPQTGVTISGAAPLFGTVAGKSLTISNSGMLHYDTRLQSVWPDIWLAILGP